MQSCPTLCNPMDCIACQAPLCMEFSRQEYWSGLPLSSLGDLPDPGIKPEFLALQADSLPSEPPGKLVILYTDFVFLTTYILNCIIFIMVDSGQSGDNENKGNSLEFLSKITTL